MSAAMTRDWAPYSMRQKFDRVMFDPKTNYTQAMILQRLRQRGHSRRHVFTYRSRAPQWHDHAHFNCCSSAALQALHGRMGDWGVFADLGCGDSADAAIVAERGFLSYGLDLFPPSDKNVRPEDFALAKFHEADLASWIPFSDGFVDYAISQAVIDLIEPAARPKFYAEVFRVMKPGGLFVLSGYPLANGYGYRAATEKRLCIAAGFRYADYFTTTMIFRKPAA